MGSTITDLTLEKPASQLTTEEKASRLKTLLHTIAPSESLESLKRNPLHGHEILEGLYDESTVIEKTNLANEALDNLDSGKSLSAAHVDSLEAIVLVRDRPVAYVVKGDFDPLPEPWTHFSNADIHKRIKSAIPSIGRIELPGQKKYPYGGTGFIVGPNLLMTNRHVAELFASGEGLAGLNFLPGLGAGWDYLHEYQEKDVSASFVEVKRVAMIHPYWDMALLETGGFPDGHAVMTLDVTDPTRLEGSDIAVIGYPAQDIRNDLQKQAEIFKGVYGVKRLQPGKVNEREWIVDFFKHRVFAIKHDASTLGGNSGSALVNAETGRVVGLHFAGIYLKTNYAVPAFELARDPRVVDAGVQFERALEPNPDLEPFWKGKGGQSPSPPPLRPDRSTPAAIAGGGGPSLGPPARERESAKPPASIAVAPANAVAGVTLSGTLNIAIRFGEVQPPPGRGDETTQMVDIEAVRIDSDYSNREGYDEKFLGTRRRTVPLPQLTTASQRKAAVENSQAEDGDRHVLPYHHFSIVMNGPRRLAFFTAVNIDGSEAKSPKREPDRWILDPRVPAEMQIANDFYGRPFDRGHLVRRLDPAWGRSASIIKKANDDTFHFTNCSPQHFRFNEGKNLWAGLEDYILGSAKNEDEQVTVFTGPIFTHDDPEYLDVQIPREFWKVMVFVDSDGKLSATGYIVSQDDLLASEGIEAPADVARTYQVAVREVASRTKLDFGHLPECDPYQTSEFVEAPAQPLTEFEQIVL